MELIKEALKKGAKIFGSVSGGKDGQAMVKTMFNNGIPVEALIHCDLGRVEWPQSLGQCQKQADEFNIPLHILTRKDGLDLLAYWERRMNLLEGTGKPFWSSPKNRYCTSDLKREPSNQFFRSCGHGLIISAEGIRAEESVARSKKDPLTVRASVTSSYYSYVAGKNEKGKPIRKFYPVEICLEMYRPDKRLVLTWFPVFNMTLDEVWYTYSQSDLLLKAAREIYNTAGTVPEWWPFHPAYVMGNERVSCMICILGSPNDIDNGIKHNPSLHQHMADMEIKSGCYFRPGLALHEKLNNGTGSNGEGV